ncbi:MAG: hypothetical protein AAF682_20425 [Planctomycetota bacterium]
MRSTAAVLVLATLPVLAGSCRVSVDPPPVPGADDPPTSEMRRVWFPGREQLKKSYVVLVHPDGRTVKHGEELEWYEDGATKAERDFRQGDPTGTWRTFYEDGSRESVVEIGDGAALLPMKWWYPDGSPRGQGMGIGGVREGEWTYWHSNGAVAEVGPFEHSRRHGWWTIYDREGRKRAEGVYDAGRRVGRWKLWDETGKLFEKDSEPPAEEPASTEPGRP